jgi:hypothetical protein
MADTQLTQSVKDLATVYKTLLLDLPVAVTKWGLGVSEEKEAAETAWKAYDVGVRLATTTIDSLYRAPLFGQVAARSLDATLRAQRLNSAVAGVFFTGLWQAVGLPTSTEVQSLRAEVRALREDVRSLNTATIVRPKKTAPVGAEEQVRTSQVKVAPNGVERPLQAAA